MPTNMAKMLINIPDELKEWAERLSGTQRMTVTDYIAALIRSDVESLTAEQRDLLLALGSRKGGERRAQGSIAPPKKASGGRSKAA